MRRVTGRYLLALAVVAVIAAAAFLFFRAPATPEVARTKAIDTGTAEPMEPLRAHAAPTPTESPAATAPPPAIEAAIFASIADRGAELRSVAVRRDAPQIACGEKRTSRDPAFRRFVWLGHLKMLATDDGSREFDRIAMICREGQSLP
ncbi:hypothetical protein NED98_09035 [Sphingomonas sp. MMSM20]|uniref:hypothetical protein n=1 Tax=Sphingomonas lycopersici TaxID=2951807 RepID=UPI002236F289|nr:hypothetical protein [Sphingomonas lycopersici]MCW6530388.1 hypothetical protein [Sphingomonas lycopersici]